LSGICDNQELIFDCELAFNLQELHVLSHECLIAGKILVSVSAMPKCAIDRCEWQLLGFVRLDDNTERNYQARERRRIEINTPNTCGMVKLTLRGCHENKLNLYNQVGLLSVALLGNVCTPSFMAQQEAAEKAERERLEKEKQEQNERLEKENLEAERLAKEKEKDAQQREEAQRKEREEQEKARLKKEEEDRHREEALQKEREEQEQQQAILKQQEEARQREEALQEEKDEAEANFTTFLNTVHPYVGELMTSDIFQKLQHEKTSKGKTLENLVEVGIKAPHLGIGIVAPDSESYRVFKDILNPVIKAWHNFDPDKDSHKSDLDPNNLVVTEDQLDVFDEYVVSCKISAVRNIKGFPLPPGTFAKQRGDVEKALMKAFMTFDDELSGDYYQLEELAKDDMEVLLKNEIVFPEPKPNGRLWACGSARDWPKNRGVFYNEDHSVTCWVNEEDHCRIISTGKGGDVQSAFQRFCELSEALNKSLHVMYDDKLGYLSSCPKNIGTGMIASIHLVVPELNKPENLGLLKIMREKKFLHVTGSDGEDAPSAGAKFEVSNARVIGLSEVELFQGVVNGTSLMLDMEHKLSAGATLEEVAAML
jgi:creatine kinase